MYPNPQDALPLPPSPDLENYRKRARDLSDACRSSEPDAIETWARNWITALARLQHEARTTPSEREVERRTEQVATFAKDRVAPRNCAVTQAQFVIARAHGFESWPKLVAHLEALGSGKATAVSAFEQAADAIVTGDLPALRRLLRDDPGLIRARSTREHRATLLHYVSANGVENYRQETPPNIVDIARVLLDAGALVDAEAEVYGGGATTLGLVVTSTPPRQAGAQIPLADLLIARGARVDAGIVDACLNNGCPEAAEHLVDKHGASLDYIEAAGLGKLDVLERLGPQPRATQIPALMMATWYDRVDVVRFLLDQGVSAGVSEGEKDGGRTALHIAAYQGSPALVELLLSRGAPVNVIDAQYQTPPLVWALHAWLAENRANAEPYKAVLRLLANAGAPVKSQWIDDERVRADGALLAVLEKNLT